MSDDLVRMPKKGDIIAGKYRIEEILGTGGMGSVYSARHETTNRKFAVKLMASSLSGDPDAKERFVREARLAGSIDHPGVVDIYDVGYHEVSLYMVMDLLKGESLGERLKRERPQRTEAIHLMMGVLKGVAAAHAKGIVHRDLKPDNIFLHREAGSQELEPKILDFGVSKSLSGGPGMPALTQTGVMLGTPFYMSPEQVHGAKDVDLRTDIYSLGVILYQMLSGQLPYKSNTFAALVLEIMTGQPPPLEELVPDLPEGLHSVVKRAMAVSTADRYPDAQSMADALAPFDTLRATAAKSTSARPAEQETRLLGSAQPAPASRHAAVTVPSPVSDTTTPYIAESPVEIPGRRSPLPIAAGAAAVVVAGVAAVFFGLGGEPASGPDPEASPADQTQASAASPVAAAGTGADAGVRGQEEAANSIPRGIEAPAEPLERPSTSSRERSRRSRGDAEERPRDRSRSSVKAPEKERSSGTEEAKPLAPARKDNDFRIEEDELIDPF